MMSQTTSSDGLVIGVDVGGTKVAAGFVSAEGKITNQVRIPMIADGDAAVGFAAVTTAVRTKTDFVKPPAHLGRY